MFPFVRKSRYNALRKDCQAWMQKAAQLKRQMEDEQWAKERLADALKSIRTQVNESLLSESVLEVE